MARPRPQLLTLSERAAARVRDVMAERGAGYLRVGVKNGGCAGMEYTMEYAAERGPHDEVIEDKGVTILIDPTTIMFLLGTEMDYQVGQLRSGFVFNNPNQTSACGCGESVMLKPADQSDAAPANVD
jgi:iron-sulfur cluster assembly protein